jgi:CheY-like chemotaxis protein
MDDLMPSILVVEDDSSDRESVCEILEHAFPDTRVCSVGDVDAALDWAQAALRWVRQCNSTEKVPCDAWPRLVLLDLHLGSADGLGLVKWLRTTKEAALTPVVVFSDSHNPAEIRRCYRAGVNSFVTKPVQFVDYSDAVTEIASYWLVRNRMPADM